MILQLDLPTLITILLIIGGGGALWFRLGRLTGEVKGHNTRLDTLFDEIKTLQINKETRRKRRKP